MEYIAVSSAPEPVYDFTNLLHREIIKRGQDCILQYPRLIVKLAAWSLLLDRDPGGQPRYSTDHWSGVLDLAQVYLNIPTSIK